VSKRIAFISDLHGNLPALEAVVADAQRRGADRIICCGDMTGYGPFPNEVCRFLEAQQIPAIAGNYDLKVIDASRPDAAFLQGMKQKKLRILLWTLEQVDKRGLRYLAGLPGRLEMVIPAGGTRFLVVHGSPLSPDDAVYPSITRQGLATKCGGPRPDVLVCAHTHIPFVRRIDNMLVVNCGSAGHPVDGDWHPSYALVRIDRKGRPQGSIVRFAYDRERVIAALEKTPLPKGLRDDFLLGNKRRFSE
jgi:putative phosphoesterase